jgi:predicted CoA-binding protein
MKKMEAILDSMKTIAVVGLSDDPHRPSYGVAQRLINKGYTIIPVNPQLNGWNGLKSYATLAEIPGDIHVDVVDVFRRHEFIADVVIDLFNMKHLPKCLWLQQGIRSEFAHGHCDKMGIVFIEDRCLPVELSLYQARKSMGSRLPGNDGMLYRRA